LSLTPTAVDALTAYGWPGNVRELENELLRASVLASGDVIEPKHFSDRVRGKRASSAPREGGTGWDGERSLAEMIAAVERDVIRQALAMTRGKKAAVARMLGISRPGLDAKLARHDIDSKTYRTQTRSALVETVAQRN
jgi:DNA-binding NtrC family response regulator